MLQQRGVAAWLRAWHTLPNNDSRVDVSVSAVHQAAGTFPGGGVADRLVEAFASMALAVVAGW